MYDSGAHMKTTSLLIAAIAVLFGAVLQLSPAYAQQETQGDSKVLTGPIRIDQLFDLEGWFGPDFIGYAPDRGYTALLKEYLQGLKILCFMGTWCDDSKIQVPRMLKVLQQGSVDPALFEMIGVDRSKKSPGGETAPFGIEKVPTFIVLKEGKEVGRIVEAPLASLEKDLVGLARKAYPDKYPVPPEPKPETHEDGSDGSGVVAPPKTK